MVFATTNNIKSAKKSKKARIFNLFLILLFLWAVGFFLFIAMLIPSQNDYENQSFHNDIDAIIVLTGGALRIDTGLNMLNDYPKAKLFISGVHHGTDVTRLLSLFNQADNAFINRIELGHEADDTPGNALEVADWVQKNNVAKAIFITSAYHMPRALTELQYRAPELTIFTAPVFSDGVKIDKWYLHSGTARLLLNEYNKYIITKGKIFTFLALDWLMEQS